MACAGCGKGKMGSSSWSTGTSKPRKMDKGTTKPTGGMKVKMVTRPKGYTGSGTAKMGDTYSGMRQTVKSGTTPISHASNGRMRRH